MKKDDPVEVVKVVNESGRESGYRIYELRTSERPRLRAEALIDKGLDSFKINDVRAKDSLSEEEYDTFREILIDDTQRQMDAFEC